MNVKNTMKTQNKYVCLKESRRTPVLSFNETVHIIGFTIRYSTGIAKRDRHHWLSGGGVSPEYV